jgi:flagellar basal body-associated protein FliL
MDHNHFPGTHNIEIEIEDHHNQAVNSRTMQDPQRLRKNISLILILLLVFMLVFVLLIQDVAIAAVLGSADKQCENIER